MPGFEVKLHPEHEHLAELCSMYWATREDGTFLYTVKVLGERFNEPFKVSRIVSEACNAVSLDRRCSHCGEGFVYRSRAQWTEGARYANHPCRGCKEEEQRRQAEQRQREEEAFAAIILDRFAVVEDELTPRAEHLDMPVAFALAALLEDAEECSRGITVPLVGRTDRYTPTFDYDFSLLSSLTNLGLLRLHPSSSRDAFVWNDDGTLGDSHYPALVSYYLSGSGSLEERVDGYLKSFAGVVSREDWPDRWTSQFSEFWTDLAVAECKAYLVHMLGRHGLDFTPGKKTDDVLRRALKWFSIGQVFYFIWRSAKESAAYLARERVPVKQAANSAVTRISAEVDRAYAQGWQVSVYQRDSRLPLSTLSHILFSRALGLDDPMSYSPLDLPLRRAGLELSWGKIDSATFERLIFQLVVETDGYENVDWLMHTNAPDHGRDVSAVRLRKDPLSGHSSQRVAIQCKHWLSTSVRDVDVNQAVVSLEHWQDPPFDVLVIATSGRFTADAVTWIERHNARSGRPSIEVWNDASLEALLGERPHLIRAYELR
ncbi:MULTISPECIES: restriction endonuclease [unclassified Micromonospora]|uniref:restriction endonuclease n=1 Tax=unclassified Micromonospora TaxID=2617518 RepID=UPI00098D6A39|nr:MULTISPECIES: restriction endonuclease [unclassified Micromonospora]MDI5938906.1 restriction endonuclease [Micromonospora sp. DH15]